MSIESRYYDGSYLAENPDWDSKDASWNAAQVVSILSDYERDPGTMCEIGCGSGDILMHLQKLLPSARLAGFNISPQAAKFLEKHIDAGSGVDFVLGDFHQLNRVMYDVLLMLDIFEHVRDPFSFLENSKRHAAHFIFHIPFDLSASSVARGKPLNDVRKK